LSLGLVVQEIKITLRKRLRWMKNYRGCMASVYYSYDIWKISVRHAERTLIEINTRMPSWNIWGGGGDHFFPPKNSIGMGTMWWLVLKVSGFSENNVCRVPVTYWAKCSGCVKFRFLDPSLKMWRIKDSNSVKFFTGTV
jgi:hypothetical protein